METLKRLAVIFACIVAASCSGSSDAQTISGGVGIHNHSSNSQGGLLGLSTALTSTKTCATNYTRISPNYCAANTAQGFQSLTDNTCTSVTAPSADARGIRVAILMQLDTSNVAVTDHQVSGTWYGDSACTTPQYQVPFRMLEQVAVLAAVLGQDKWTYDMVLSVVGGNAGVKTVCTVGPCLTQTFIQGYFD